ncbi:GNAT family N-acetyltransferase [Aquirufa ecclesiirivi]
MIIKKLEILDVSSIAELHLRAFSNFFLTSLGKFFLCTFYSAILNDSQSISLGLFENNVLIGFAIGSKRNKSFYKNLIRNNFFKLSLSAFIPFISNPGNIFKLISSLTSFSNSNGNFVDSAVLLSICIEPNSSSHGLGKKLLIKFEEVAFENSNSILLTTDAENNLYVNKFYSNNGYLIESEYFQGKRKMNLYIKHN